MRLALRAVHPEWPLVVGILALLQLAHLIARGQVWAVDAQWAVQFYLFSMVFFGPAVSGIAAWSGVALVRSGWLSRVGPWRAIRMVAGTILVLAVLVFLAGLVVALGFVLAKGAPLGPARLADRDVLVALVGICGYWGFGVALGAFVPNRLVPAVAAAVAFAATMAMWMGGLDSAVQFGATGGSYELLFGPQVQVSRLLLWAGLAATGLALARHRIPPSPSRVVFAAMGAGIVALVGLGLGAAQGSVFRFVPPDFQCIGEQPQVCVPKRSAWLLPQAQRALQAQGMAAQVYSASRHAGGRAYIDSPETMSLIADYAGETLSPELNWMLGAAVESLYAPRCQVALTGSEPEELPADLERARNRIDRWVISQTTIDGDPPTRLRRMQIGSAEAEQFLAANLDILPPCPR